ncbi:MAG: DUF1003 domain-containing protein [Pirellulaceae bacterium]|nr:DUF1003 domain-containing protein [Pirellulaceae bacterium]
MKQAAKESMSESPIGPVVRRNMRALVAAHERAETKKSFSERVSDVICAFSGSTTFVLLHVIWFSAWILLNLDVGGWEPFDPFPYGLLTMIVSLEAIFLSTFVLISQNRQAKLGDERADLDVQIDLLAEHEVTRILCVVTAIAEKLQIRIPAGPDMHELEKDIEPDELLKELEKQAEN